MDDEEWLRLYLLLGQDAEAWHRALARFGTPARALAAHPARWRETGLRQAMVEAFADWPDGPAARALCRQWRQACDWLRQPGNGLWRQRPEDVARQWPRGLRAVEEPPPLLFLQGDEAVLGLPQIAVVGSRAATRQGRMLAGEISADLARAGFAVTSGLASGIDAAAHEGALSVAGRTLAVMGCGLDRVYPPANAGLAERIVASGGLLVSEFAPGTPPDGWRFPRRNRVIGALSLGVLVVEAGPDSGSLITARLAEQMSRPVWAVPGSVLSLQSRGCHQLIRSEQARLVESARDIVGDVLPLLREWFADAVPAPLIASADGTGAGRLPPGEEAAGVLAVMEAAPCTFDELVALSGLSPSRLLAALGELEVSGWLVAVPGGYQRLSA